MACIYVYIHIYIWKIYICTPSSVGGLKPAKAAHNASWAEAEPPAPKDPPPKDPAPKEPPPGPLPIPPIPLP